MKQSFSSHVTFLSSREFSDVFAISSSHANTNLLIRHFLQEQFFVSKYMSILHALLHSQSCELGFHVQSSSQEPQSCNSLH